MDWYYIAGIVVAVITVAIAIVKNKKVKSILENSKIAVEEARKALEDGKITKAEFASIILKALDAFF